MMLAETRYAHQNAEDEKGSGLGGPKEQIGGKSEWQEPEHLGVHGVGVRSNEARTGDEVEAAEPRPLRPGFSASACKPTQRDPEQEDGEQPKPPHRTATQRVEQVDQRRLVIDERLIEFPAAEELPSTDQVRSFIDVDEVEPDHGQSHRERERDQYERRPKDATSSLGEHADGAGSIPLAVIAGDGGARRSVPCEGFRERGPASGLPKLVSILTSFGALRGAWPERHAPGGVRAPIRRLRRHGKGPTMRTEARRRHDEDRDVRHAWLRPRVVC